MTPATVQKPGGSFATTLGDAAAAGGLAAVLGFFFLALRTDIATGGLVVTTRWFLLVTAALLVFFGRLLLNVFFFRRGSVEERLASAAAAVLAASVWGAVAGVRGAVLGDLLGAAVRSAAIGVLAASIGVAVLALISSWRTPGLVARGRVLAAVGDRLAGVGAWVGWLLLAFGFALPFLIGIYFPGQYRQYIDLAILILTYIMLGWGLNIVVGLAGLLDLGYVAFYAVGAYSFALIAQHFGLGFWSALPLAGALAACWGLILGFPVLRLRGDYLAIVTLAFGEIIRIILLNWYDFTNGPNGISGIPKPTFFGLDFTRGEGGVADFLGIEYAPIHRFIYLYYIILVLAIITNLVTIRLRRLPVGRAWEALREDEVACRSLGINTTNTKLTAFAIGAMFGGIAGSFFATRQGFISPESFSFIESATILAIVVLGGLGSQIGVVIAAVVMIGGIEMLRNLDFLKQVFGPDFEPTQYRMLFFGAAMVLIMVWKPRGLISTREPTMALKVKKRIGADLVGQGEGH